MHSLGPQASGIPDVQPSFLKKTLDFLDQKVFRVAFAIFSWIGNKVYRLFKKDPSPAAPPTVNPHIPPAANLAQPAPPMVDPHIPPAENLEEADLPMVDPRIPPAANLEEAEEGFYTGNAPSRRIIDRSTQRTRYFWVMDLLYEGQLHARFNQNGRTVFDSNFEVCEERYRLFRERMGQMVQGFDEQTKIKIYDFSSREYLLDGLFRLNQSFQERWMILPSWQVETLEFTTSATQLIAQRTLTEVPVYDPRLKQNVYYTMIVTRTLSRNQDTQEFSFQLNPR